METLANMLGFVLLSYLLKKLAGAMALTNFHMQIKSGFADLIVSILTLAAVFSILVAIFIGVGA